MIVLTKEDITGLLLEKAKDLLEVKEQEMVAEISKATLGSYIHKASTDAERRYRYADTVERTRQTLHRASDDVESRDSKNAIAHASNTLHREREAARDKARKRSKHITKAVHKLTSK